MFTGIVQMTGHVEEIKKKNDSLEIRIRSKLNPSLLMKGESISVNGVCLTVEASSSKSFSVTCVPETLNRTNLSFLNASDIVNLEAPLTLSQGISGHLVSGHVDFVAKVISPAPNLKISINKNYAKFFPTKSSVCINGVSLTVVKSSKNHISVAIIPETMKSTNLSLLKVNDSVNVEVDIIARYLNRLVNA